MNDLLLQELLDAGTPPLLVAKVAAEIARASAANDILEQRRAHERERKARSRSREVTGQHVTARDGADAPLSLSPNENNSNPHTHTPVVNITRARKGDPFPRPDFADPLHWHDFLENRKRKRLPNTASAHAKMLREIDRWTDAEWPPGRIIQHAAEKGWAGIYNPREDQEHQNGRLPPQRNLGMGRSGADASGADLLAELRERRKARANGG